MKRIWVGVLVIIALFLAAVGAGMTAAKRFGSQRILAEVEGRLTTLLGTSVSVGRLRVQPGTFIRIEGEQLTAWLVDGTPGLTIERVSGSVDAASLLGGEIELARLLIDGVRLRLAASGHRGWSPLGSDEAKTPMIAPATAQPAVAPEDAVAAIPGTRTGDVAQPLELLAPLISLETALRRVMTAPRVAGVLEFRDVTISFEHEGETNHGALRLENLRGRLVQRRFGRGSELTLNARLSADGRDRGGITLTGRRGRDDAVRIVLNMEAVELAAGARYVRGIQPDATFNGILSGQWIYETPQLGTGRLQAKLIVQALENSVTGTQTALAVVRSPQIDVSGVFEITPQSATLRNVRATNRDTSVSLSGEVARPLRSGSLATVDLALRNLELGQARHLIGWLPEIERMEAAAVLAPLKQGRLAALRAQGSATLSEWQDLLAGRTRKMPRGFEMEAELADTVAWVADTNRLEGLAAKLRWVDSRVEIEQANAVLNGAPLPTLDLVIDGFPNFLAGDPGLREMDSSALPLVGLPTLWESLRPKPDSVSVDVGTHVGLEIESFVHPLFLWPMWDVSATIETRSDSVRIVAKRAIWAGVPIRGELDWLFQPEERMTIRIVAEPPESDTAVPERSKIWARGGFEIGPILGGRWKQKRAVGRFAATDGRVRIRDLDIDLAPAGAARADGSFDLSIRGEVPFRVNFGVVGGDASALAKLVGLPERQVAGQIDADGSFEGRLKPGTSFFAKLNGLLDIRAFDGEIRKLAPPVVAIAEASESIESFDPGDVVAFERVETVLEFENGGLFSEAFSLDGPEVGVVASGDVQLAFRDKTIEAQVFLFLFRKLDRVLGKIPILNRLLLGTDENLIAAAFRVSGHWSDPQVDSIPLPSSFGPASQVLQGVPLFVMRGIRALGSLVKLDAPSTVDHPLGAQGGS